MKTKLLLTVIVLLTGSFTFLSAKMIKGNGEIITQEISVLSYHAVEFGSGVNGSRQGFDFLLSLLSSKRGSTWEFNYSQQSGPSGVKVSIDENLLPYLNIETSNGILIVSTKSGNTIAPTRLIINGHSEALHAVRASSGVDFNILTPITGEKIDLQSSGGSDIRIKEFAKIGQCNFRTSGGGDIYAEKLECREIAASASGGSDILLKGKTEKATFKASGGSDIKAFDLQAKEIDFSISGGSDLELHVTDLLSGKASGGSGVRYYGDPRQDVSVSGGSSCKKK